MINCVRHSVPRRSKVESQRVRSHDVAERDVGRNFSPRREEEGLLAERWGNRWWRKGVRRKDACTRMRTHLVSWPGALAGPGGQECAVACGWDPPVSVPACSPSPHTSRLFILHCGKITAPAVSSGPCKVYIACPEVHVYNTILPNSPSHKAETNWHISPICKHYWVDLTQLTKDSFSVSLMQRNKFTKTRVCNAFEKY